MDFMTASVSVRPQALAGIFLGEKGRRLTFDGASVSWEEAGKNRAGVCVFFSLAGQDVMTIRFSGEPASLETVNYALDLREKREAGRITRTLVLTPVQLTVSGYQEVVGERLTLEQTVDAQKK
jgi:hypothetical protein